MNEQRTHPVINKLIRQHHSLTAKGKVLSDYITRNTRKAVFMTAKELSEACSVSEATVVRFVVQSGYKGYGDFLQALRDVVNTELTLLDRADLSDLKGKGANRLRRAVSEEIDNLQQFYETADINKINDLVDYLARESPVYVIGSRLSYTFAYYLGWSLTKIRSDVHILQGSDDTCVDWLTIAHLESIVVIIATSRYPNELIRLGKLVRRLGHTLIVIADSRLCPLNQFAHLSLTAPSKHIPFIGSPTTISCIITHLVIELASRYGKRIQKHQQKLEKSYRESDILFNLDDDLAEYKSKSPYDQKGLEGNIAASKVLASR